MLIRKPALAIEVTSFLKHEKRYNGKRHLKGNAQKIKIDIHIYCIPLWIAISLRFEISTCREINYI